VGMCPVNPQPYVPKYILPVITYTCESLVTGQPHKLKVLEHAQNRP